MESFWLGRRNLSALSLGFKFLINDCAAWRYNCTRENHDASRNHFLSPHLHIRHFVGATEEQRTCCAVRSGSLGDPFQHCI